MRPSSTGLSYREVGRAFFPLGVSWLLMAVEAPVCTRIAFSLPNAEVNVSAILAMFSLALLIESPIIDLLGTATTLARNRPSYTAIRGFALGLMALCGLVHGVVALPPVFEFVAYRMAGLSPEVGSVVHVPFATMLLWSPLIGWRRFKQGVLIRAGKSRQVGVGTIVRLGTLVLVGSALAATGTMEGAQVAAAALVSSVGAEALAVHLLARPAVRGMPVGGEPPSLRRLVGFHAPLTLATLVQLMMFGVMVPSLARLPDPVTSMASWQALASVAFLAQTATFALPEVVIALADRPRSWPVLRSFCAGVGSGLSVLVLLCVATGAQHWLFSQLLGTTERVAAVASAGLAWMAVLPALRAVGNLYRGFLTAEGVTVARLVAIGAGAAVMAGVLALGIASRWQGVTTAVAAVVASAVAEGVALALLWNRRKAMVRRLAEAAQ